MTGLACSPTGQLVTSDFCFVQLHHTSAGFRHPATNRALPRCTFPNCLPRYRPSQGEESRPVNSREHACVGAGVHLAWNNEWLQCQLVCNYACCLCVLGFFLEGKCTLSHSSGEQQEAAAPHVCLHVHLSQSKADDTIKIWRIFLNHVTPQPH